MPRVYGDADGRQYAIDDERQRVEGVWLFSAEGPMVVSSNLPLPLPFFQAWDEPPRTPRECSGAGTTEAHQPAFSSILLDRHDAGEWNGPG
jgi:hypothetical protein